MTKPSHREIAISFLKHTASGKVREAFTFPKIYIQWLGPRELVMTLEKFEPRSGGSWRYIHTDKYGNEYAFHGVNHEVTAGMERGVNDSYDRLDEILAKLKLEEN